MASLWNFVSRFTSRRHREPQRSLPTAVEQQGAATPPAARTVSDDVARLGEPPPAGAIAGKRVDAVGMAAGLGTARATDATAFAVSDHGGTVAAAEPDAQTSLPAPRAVARRRHKNKPVESVAGRQLAVAPTVSDQIISLDDEIKLLRGELIGKLELQNAQLKTMLERFER